MQLIGRWLWYLLAANPMVVRIVQGGSRRMRHQFVRWGYLGFMTLLVLFSLLAGGGSAGTTLTDLAKAGTATFAIVAWGQVILVCLFAPLFMAGAIGSEQQGETLEILLTTPLSNLQIVLGSLLGRLFFILALVLSGLPLFSVLLVFGGVPISSVFVAFGVAGLTALFVGAAAVAMSVFRLGGRKAVFGFVIVVVGYLLLGYLLDTFILRRLGAANQTTWLTPLHPLLVLEAFTNTANYRRPDEAMVAGWPAWTRFYFLRPFTTFAILTSASSLVMLVGSSFFLRLLGEGEGRISGAIKRAMLLGGGVARAGREVWRNPIAWREANTRGNARGGRILRYAYLILGLIFAMGGLLAYHFDITPTIQGGTGSPLARHEVLRLGILILVMLEVLVVALIAIYMAAGCVSREREDGTLDLILTTPVTPKEYIWGKLRGLISFLGTLIALPVLTLALVAGYGVIAWAIDLPQATYTATPFAGNGQVTVHPLVMPPAAPLWLLLVLTPFVALCVAAGMSWSLKSKGVLGAVVPSVVIMGGLALVLGFCGLSAAQNIPFVGPIINAFSPATGVLMIVDPWHYAIDFAPEPGLGYAVVTIAVLVAAGGYSVLVWGMLTGMVRGFDQTVRRLSGTG